MSSWFRPKKGDAKAKEKAERVGMKKGFFADGLTK